MDAPLVTDDDLFLMANLRPTDTGLPMVVWVGERGNAQHDAQIRPANSENCV